MNWHVILSRQAVKDATKLKSAGLWRKANDLLTILENNPYQTPPSYEKLGGDMAGFHSRRINIQHRLVYQVNNETREVKFLRMWMHYE